MGGQGHLVPLQLRMSVLLKSIITLWRLGEGSLLWPAQKDCHFGYTPLLALCSGTTSYPSPSCCFPVVPMAP